MIYLHEYEFDIFGDLKNVENELENMIVKWYFDFYNYDYDLCNGPQCPTAHSPPRHHIILLVVEIILEILLKCVFDNEINENENWYTKRKSGRYRTEIHLLRNLNSCPHVVALTKCLERDKIYVLILEDAPVCLKKLLLKKFYEIPMSQAYARDTEHKAPQGLKNS